MLKVVVQPRRLIHGRLGKFYTLCPIRWPELLCVAPVLVVLATLVVSNATCQVMSTDLGQQRAAAPVSASASRENTDLVVNSSYPGYRRVTSGASLLNAALQPEVDYIDLAGDVAIDSNVLRTYGRVDLKDGRNITIASSGAPAARYIINFNQLPAVFTVWAGSELTLFGVVLFNLSDSTNPLTHSLPRAVGLGSWPSVVAMPGAQVNMSFVVGHFKDLATTTNNCSNRELFTTVQRYNAVFGPDTMALDAASFTLYTLSTITLQLSVKPGVNSNSSEDGSDDNAPGDTLGTVTLYSTNNTVVCVPLPPPDTSAQQPVMAPAPDSLYTTGSSTEVSSSAPTAALQPTVAVAAVPAPATVAPPEAHLPAAAPAAPADHSLRILAVVVAISIGATAAIFITLLLRRRHLRSTPHNVEKGDGPACPQGSSSCSGSATRQTKGFLFQEFLDVGGSEKQPPDDLKCSESEGWTSLSNEGISEQSSQPQTPRMGLDALTSLVALGKFAAAPPTDVELLQVLDSGAFGRVYKGRWRGALVAVKVLDHARNQTLLVARESVLSVALSHPNLVATYKVCQLWNNGDDGTWQTGRSTIGPSTPHSVFGTPRPQDAAQLNAASGLTAAGHVLEQQSSGVSLTDSTQEESYAIVTASSVATTTANQLDTDEVAAEILADGKLRLDVPPNSCVYEQADKQDNPGSTSAFQNQAQPYCITEEVPPGSDCAAHRAGSLTTESPFFQLLSATADSGTLPGAPSPQQLPSLETDSAILDMACMEEGPLVSGSPVRCSTTDGNYCQQRQSGSMDAAESDNSLHETWLILEYCDRGSLDRLIKAKRFRRPDGSPDMASIYPCLGDICQGMEYLHSHGILHGDLKAGNVMVKSTMQNLRRYVCKLGDFGLSRMLDVANSATITQTFGTVSYMPPEVLNSGRLTKAADVYSFAILMWELFTCEPAFPAYSTLGQVYFLVAVQGHRPHVPPHCPPHYAALMRDCWQEDPEQRPTFTEILLRLHSELNALRQSRTRAQSAARPGATPGAARRLALEMEGNPGRQ